MASDTIEGYVALAILTVSLVSAEEISERSLRLQTPGIFEKLIPHAGPRALFLEAWNEWKGVNIVSVT